MDSPALRLNEVPPFQANRGPDSPRGDHLMLCIGEHARLREPMGQGAFVPA